MSNRRSKINWNGILAIQIPNLLSFFKRSFAQFPRQPNSFRKRRATLGIFPHAAPIVSDEIPHVTPFYAPSFLICSIPKQGIAHKFYYELEPDSSSSPRWERCEAHKQHAEITCLKFVTPLVKKWEIQKNGGERISLSWWTWSWSWARDFQPAACNRKYPESEGETLFALDFINRKTSTQVSVSLGPAGGGFDGDDWPTGIGTGKPLKNSDPRTIPGVEKWRTDSRSEK